MWWTSRSEELLGWIALPVPQKDPKGPEQKALSTTSVIDARLDTSAPHLRPCPSQRGHLRKQRHVQVNKEQFIWGWVMWDSI